MAGHMLKAMQRVHSIETKIKANLNLILTYFIHIYLYCTVSACTMPTLCLFLLMPRVDLQSVIVAVLGHTL